MDAVGSDLLSALPPAKPTRYNSSVARVFGADCQSSFFVRKARFMEKELLDRAEAIQQRLVQLRDSL